MSQARSDAVNAHLTAMLAADTELYERVLDTTGFAYHFNQLLLMALADGYKSVVEDDSVTPPPDVRTVHYPNGLDDPQPYLQPEP